MSWTHDSTRSCETNAIGSSLTLDGVPFVIVGVTPPEFFGAEVGRSFDVAVPIGTEPLIRGDESELDARSHWWLDIVARLRTHQSAADATRALRGVSARDSSSAKQRSHQACPRRR